jgi:hypothetical protein
MFASDVISSFPSSPLGMSCLSRRSKALRTHPMGVPIRHPVNARTGQLTCYLIRTTHELTTLRIGRLCKGTK